jgi:hypothetical protein
VYGKVDKKNTIEKPITHQINDKIFELLEKHPEGMRWVNLRKALENPKFHPKTVNGLIWNLTEKFPDKVYKPEKGLFRLTKFK